MTCTCGAPYTPTTDGRARHRMIHGHAPSPKPAPPKPAAHRTNACEHGRHEQCGGGVKGGFECTCACGHRWA